jgi:hypothetical protein
MMTPPTTNNAHDKAVREFLHGKEASAESRGELIHEPAKEGYTPMVRRRVPPLRQPTDPTPFL